ncbi:MAG: sugar phosphate isomerase/epimerase [Treponema sp.]|jgi:sugar phosphate isomerase/epimerase|nr:sugar phosphate isomerase/epimerase [Treponema sp.]
MIKRAIALSPRVSRFAPLFFSGTLERGIEAAASLGFDGVEISVGNPGTLESKKIKSMVSDKGLEIVTLGTGQSYVDDGLPLVTDDSAVLNKTLERLKKVIDFAGERGSKYVTIGGIRAKAMYAGHDEMVKRLAEPLNICAQHALECKVGILLEPVNRYEVSTIFRLEQAHALMKEAACENISLLYDVFHGNIEESSITTPIVKYANNIGTVHFADSNRLVPFKGHIPFFEIAHCLKAVSYSGYVTIEALPEPEDFIAAKQAIGALNILLL